PGCPLVLLGHSLGGLIALRYVEEYPAAVAGAALSSPWMGTAGIPVPRWKTLAAPVLSRLLPSLPTRARIDPTLLSRDPEVVERYRDDPLVHDIITPRAFTEASDAIGMVLPRSDRIRVPLLFLLGTEDRLMPPARSVAFARATGRSEAVALFTGFYHEVLQEPGREAVEGRMREWLAALRG
ncbi:MAG TPA: alpha/beta fold hydrolase, partial [Longimicrobiales bacterium]|nr:alpha/beta fold hydrolase [Longimicrobiales bacterium]